MHRLLSVRYCSGSPVFFALAVAGDSPREDYADSRDNQRAACSLRVVQVPPGDVYDAGQEVSAGFNCLTSFAPELDWTAFCSAQKSKTWSWCWKAPVQGVWVWLRSLYPQHESARLLVSTAWWREQQYDCLLAAAEFSNVQQRKTRTRIRAWSYPRLLVNTMRPIETNGAQSSLNTVKGPV